MANYQLEQTGAEVQALLNAVESPDTTPAAGSSNLITSGAVQAAVAGVSAEVTALGHKVLNNSLYGNNNYVAEQKIYGLIPGRVYKILFKNPNWDMSGVTLDNTYSRFFLQSYHGVNYTELTGAKIGSQMQPEYYFEVPGDSDYCAVNIRATLGVLVEFSFEDVTDSYFLSKNLKSRLYVTPECSGDISGELSIADENGNVICKFKDGQIKTKNFDSIGAGQLSTADAEHFYITDGNGNVVLEVVGGHIKTMNFDSADVSKKYGTVSVMGDSWSALKNYVYPTDNAYYYPSSDPGAQGYGTGNDVENVEQMWWYLLATQMKTRVMRIAARSGSRIANSSSTTTSFLGREGDIGDFPELILVLGTRNDDNNTDLGEYKYSDWTDSDLEDYRPAVAKLLSDLLHNNIGSQILFVSNSANADKISSAQTICEHYGVPFLLVTLNNEQVTGSHPNSAGMSFICSEIFNKLNTL